MPNILIETLGGDKSQIRAAYYYDVPAQFQLAGAVDATREPARGSSTNLDQAGKDGLKAGAVFEYIRMFRVQPGQTVDAVKAAMIADRIALQSEALDQYQERFRYVGVFYNGTNWG